MQIQITKIEEEKTTQIACKVLSASMLQLNVIIKLQIRFRMRVEGVELRRSLHGRMELAWLTVMTRSHMFCQESMCGERKITFIAFKHLRLLMGEFNVIHQVCSRDKYQTAILTLVKIRCFTGIEQFWIMATIDMFS